MTAADELSADVCLVRWLDARRLRPGDERLLSEAERRQVSRAVAPDVRQLRLAARVLLRCVVAEAVGADVRDLVIERRCPTCGRGHGRPVLPGVGVEVSATHSGHVTGVALCASAPVGLDLECVDRFAGREFDAQLLGRGERATGAADRCRYWTRKEAVAKATGDGIGVGLTDLLVSAPAETAALLHYPGCPGLRVALHDLDVIDGYRASVAVLGRQRAEVRATWFELPAAARA